MIYKYIIAILIVLIKISFQSKQQPEFNSNGSLYTYLPQGQGSMHFNLTSPVTFDRKRFRDIWIYKNGLITLGAPLEEGDYPIMMENGVQPFENIVGSNIVAVFIVKNKLLTESLVRAKQNPLKLVDSKTQKLIKLMESKIHKVYGNLVISPIEDIIDIEWIKMKPEGIDDEKSNTFRLLLLSTKTQTFCVFHLIKIDSVIYKIKGKSSIYQSGLSSYSEMKYILPPYNVTRNDNQLHWTSNIGIENIWLITIGDTSYNIDFGWPQNFIYSKSDEKFNNLKTLKQFKEGFKTFKLRSFDFTVDQAISNIPISKGDMVTRKKVFKSKRTAENMIENDLRSTDLPDSLFLTNHPIADSFTTENYFPISTTNFDEYKPTLMKITSKGEETYSKTPYGIETRNREMESSIHQSWNGLRTIESSSTPHQKMIRFIRPESNIRNALYEDSKLFKKNNLETNVRCSTKLCLENEECLLVNENPCCKCKPGSSLRNKKCVQNDKNFYTKSGGNVKLAIMATFWNLELILQITKETSTNESFPRAHIMLMSKVDLSEEIRNVLLLLYPLFHIPMSFYASSWNNQDVANMNSLVDKEAGIQIYLEIGNLEKVYITFKLSKQENEDNWNILVDGIDMQKLKDLKLNESKFDEKSLESYNLLYTVQNSNSIEFPLQTIHFQDESNSNFINITWRGTMQFTATCLSNLLNNKKYYVKFSDKSYCNSDCYPESDNKKACRILCLGSPHVFDNIPDPCQGNFCEKNQRCINLGTRYECRCMDEMSVDNDGCSNKNMLVKKITLPAIIQECKFCSDKANCLSVNAIECCTCKTGYFGSGIKCLEKNSEFELRMSGIVSVIQRDKYISSDKTISLLFRQYKTENGLNYASFLEIGNFPYSTVHEQQLLDFILLLSPLFDVPLALFASRYNQSQMENIYALSKGFAKIELKIESPAFDPIKIFLEFSEVLETIQISVNVSGIPTDLDSNWLIDTHNHFSNRGISIIKYSITKNKIIFDMHEIKLPKQTQLSKMSWKGTGEFHKCVHHVPERNFEINSNNQFDCKPRCLNQSCKPYCQAISTIQELPTKSICSPSCQINEKCVEEHCICADGYVRQNSHCQPINKHLECQRFSDCEKKQFMECKNNICVCIAGYDLRDNECVMNDKCRFCEASEECINGDCICKRDFVRNRISQQCIFDCSQCDPYSTSCNNTTCVCHSGFKSSKMSNKSCQLICSSDSDCPTYEKCDATKVCICPVTKNNGICMQSNGCSSCHKNSVCEENVCKCNPDWLGDGISCTYNCSLCFDRRHCSSNLGCSCPSEYEGDGKVCKRKGCREKCPRNSVCIKEREEYKCKCENKFIKMGNKCINDSVQINILPPNHKLEIREGNNLDLFCLGTSKSIEFHVYWSRQSSKQIQGKQEYLDPLNRTLKLSLFKMQLMDSDQYICGSKLGESKSVTITVIREKALCLDQCNSFAVCENKKCKCLKNYFGDGINCYPKQQCIQRCKSYEICNETIGKCVCKAGFFNYKDRCVKDCRKQGHCDINAKCNSSTGLCECAANFVGNGTNCWKQSSNCLLTRRCAANATCTMIPGVLQHLCLCNQGFVGDGSLFCHPRIDCSFHRCGPKAFCEPFIVENQFGNLVVNGKCSCEPGYTLINNKCSEIIKTSATIWVSMGESIISHKLGENISTIQYIDVAKNNGIPGIITSMTGDCKSKRLIWAGKNGMSIQSSYVNNFSNVTTHLSNLGKIMGMSTDEITSNVYFSDSYKGRIGVIDIVKNVSKILIEKANYSPGPLVVHSKSGKIFWIVNDYQDPRIEMAELTGENNSIFATLNRNAISLTMTSDVNSNDKLCWIEVNRNIEINQRSGNNPDLSILKCIDINNISRRKSSKIEKIHKIFQEEPFSALAYFQKQFYWSVRRGAFLKFLGPTESKLNIYPNCCDVRIRGLKILTDECSKEYSQKNNPCWRISTNSKCSDLCVVKLNEKHLFESVCLNRNT